MAISDEVTTRLGTPLLIELTRFDAQTSTTVDTSRLNAAIADAETMVRREVGIVEPTDTTTDGYATFVALVVKATRYYLLWYRAPEGEETKAALAEFRDQAERWRARTAVALVTDSPVDVTDEDDDDRDARFAPSHFQDFRIA